MWRAHWHAALLHTDANNPRTLHTTHYAQEACLAIRCACLDAISSMFVNYRSCLKKVALRRSTHTFASLKSAARRAKEEAAAEERRRQRSKSHEGVVMDKESFATE